MAKIYVASSWRNYVQASVVFLLRSFGHEVYDFRNPAPGNFGFRWKEIDPHYSNWDKARYLIALQTNIAEQGFRFDMDALRWADTCVLVLPCGRSAHLEAGFAKGAGKRLFILLGEEKLVPELMYKMADAIFPGVYSFLDFFEKDGR